jgi:hypothetical protein
VLLLVVSLRQGSTAPSGEQPALKGGEKKIAAVRRKASREGIKQG